MPTHYDHALYEHFIPITYDELLCHTLQHLHSSSNDTIQKIATALQQYYHLRFARSFETLQREYEPFNPDSELVTMCTPDTRTLERIQSHLTAILQSQHDANTALDRIKTKTRELLDADS